MNRVLRRLALAGLCLMLLASCKSRTSFPASLVGYNHTTDEITFSVDGYGSIYQGPHSGGGGFTCCIRVPETWRPDLTVKVQWLVGVSKQRHERAVPVPRYNQGGRLAVHFLRNGQLAAFVTPYALWHPDYPLKGEDAQIKPGQDPRPPR